MRTSLTMKRWTPTVMVVALLAFVLSPWMWPSPPGSMEPAAVEVPFFMMLTIFESLALGLGVAFLWNLYPVMKKQKGDLRKEAWIIYLAVGWMLVNWWFHDGLHKMNGSNTRGLLLIEYAFHVSLFLAGVAMVRVFVKMWSLGRWWWVSESKME